MCEHKLKKNQYYKLRLARLRITGLDYSNYIYIFCRKRYLRYRVLIVADSNKNELILAELPPKLFFLEKFHLFVYSERD